MNFPIEQLNETNFHHTEKREKKPFVLSSMIIGFQAAKSISYQPLEP